MANVRPPVSSKNAVSDISFVDQQALASQIQLDLGVVSDMVAPSGERKPAQANRVIKKVVGKKKDALAELDEANLVQDAPADVLVAQAGAGPDSASQSSAPASAAAAAASAETAVTSGLQGFVSAVGSAVSSVASTFATLGPVAQVAAVVAGVAATAAAAKSGTTDAAGAPEGSGGTNGGTSGGTNGGTGGSTNGGTSGGTNGGTSGGTNGGTSGGINGGTNGGTGGGTNVVANPQFIAGSTTIVGVLTAGPVAPNHDLQIAAYDGNGNAIQLFEASGSQVAEQNGVIAQALNRDGSFSINVGTYVGPVILRVFSSGSDPDYYDEATGQTVNMGIDLQAAAVIEKVGGQVNLVIHVTPLAQMVLEVLKATQGVESFEDLKLTAAEVVKYNKAIAEAFGLGLVDITKVLPAAVNAAVALGQSDVDGLYGNMANGQSFQVSEVSDLYGMTLAVLSQMDANNNGDASLSISQLLSSLNVDATTQDVLIRLTDSTALSKAKVDALASDLITLAYAPTAADYARIGVDGVTDANIAAVNQKVAGLTASGVTAAGSISMAVGNAAVEALGDYQASVDSLQQWIDGAYASGSALTAADFAKLGVKVVTGVTASTQQVQELSSTQVADLNTILQTQAVSSVAEVVDVWKAIQKIDAWVADSSNPNRAPSAADYALIGRVDVDGNNLKAVNNTVAELEPTSTLGILQGLDASNTVQVPAVAAAAVTAYGAAVNSLANYAAALQNATAPTSAEYLALGLGELDADQVTFLNAALQSAGGMTADDVSGFAEAALRVLNWTSDATVPSLAPTLADYQLLGLDAVTASNLDAINAAAAQATDFTTVTSGIQTADAAYDAAILAIRAHASGASNTAPTLDQYTQAGVYGVTAENLSSINAALASKGVVTADTLQEVVGSALVLLAWVADGSLADAAPSLTDFRNLGYTTVNNGNIALVIADLAGSEAAAWADIVTGLDTVTEAFAESYTSLSGFVASGGTAPTLETYAALGLTGVTEGNLASVNAAFNALTAIRTSNVAATTYAVLKILAWQADSTDPLNAPTVEDYRLAGVTTVTAGNLAAINATVADTVLGSAANLFTALNTDAIAAVTAYNTAMSAVAAYAAGFLSTAPTAADYEALGLSNATGLADALNEALLQRGAVSEALLPQLLQAIITVKNFADGAVNAPAPTVNDYHLIGFTEVSSANLARINNITQGVDSQSYVQNGDFVATLADHLDSAATAVAVLQAYAAGGSTAPTADNYADAGITDVTDLTAVNTALQSAGWSDFDDAEGIVALSVLTDFAGGGTTAPALADFAAAGISGVTAYNLAAVKQALQTLGSVDQGLNGATLNSATQVLAMARVLSFADDSNQSAPTAQDFSALLGETVAAGNVAEINARLAAGVQSDFDSIAKVMDVVDAVSALASDFVAQRSSSNQTTINLDSINDLGYSLTNSEFNTYTNGQYPALPGFIRAASADQVSSVAGIKTLLDAFFHLNEWQAGTSLVAPTLQEYQVLGYSNLTPALVSSYNSQLQNLSGSFAPASLVNVNSESIVSALESLNDWMTGVPSVMGNLADGSYNEWNALWSDLGISLNNASGFQTYLRETFAGEELTYAQLLTAKSTYAAETSFADWTLRNYNSNYLPSVEDFEGKGFAGVTSSSRTAIGAAIAAEFQANQNSLTVVQRDQVIEDTLDGLATAWDHIKTWLGDPTTTAPTLADFEALGLTVFAAANLYVNGADTSIDVDVIQLANPTNPNPYTNAELTLADFNAMLQKTSLNADSTQAELTAVLSDLYYVANADERYIDGADYARAWATFGVTGIDSISTSMLESNDGRLFGLMSSGNFQIGYYRDGNNGIYRDVGANQSLDAFLTAFADLAETALQTSVSAFAAWANGSAAVQGSLTAPTSANYLALGYELPAASSSYWGGYYMVTSYSSVLANLNQILADKDFSAHANDQATLLTAIEDVIGAFNAFKDYRYVDNYSVQYRTPPTLAQFEMLGFTGITADNLVWAQTAIKDIDLSSDKLSGSTQASVVAFDLVTSLQTEIDTDLATIQADYDAAVVAILDWAAGTSQTAPTSAEYAALLGASMSLPDDFVNDAVAASPAGSITTVAAVKALVDQLSTAWSHVRQGQADLDDYLAIGCTTVDNNNLDLVNGAIARNNQWQYVPIAEAKYRIDGGTFINMMNMQQTFDGITNDIQDAWQTVYDWATAQNGNPSMYMSSSSLNSNASLNDPNHNLSNPPAFADYQLLGLAGNSSGFTDGLLTDGSSQFNLDNHTRFNAWLASVQPYQIATLDGMKDQIEQFNAYSKLLTMKTAGSVTASVADWDAAGFVGVNENNLSLTNHFLKTMNGGYGNSPQSVDYLLYPKSLQAQLNYKLDGFEGTLDDLTNFDMPSLSYMNQMAYGEVHWALQALMITGVPNSQSDSKYEVLAPLFAASTDIFETRDDVQAVFDYYTAAVKVIEYAADQTKPMPTDADYLTLGIEGLSSGMSGALNLAVIADASIVALDDTVANDVIGLKADIQGLVAATQAQSGAILDAFKAYADDPVNAIAPTAADYQALGITLTDPLVTAVNSTLAHVFGRSINTATDVEALVDDTVIDLGAGNGQLLGAQGGTYTWNGVFATELYVWDKNDDGQITAADQVSLSSFLADFASDRTNGTGVGYEPPKFTINDVDLQMISAGELLDTNSGGPVLGMTADAFPAIWGGANLFHTGTTDNAGMYSTFKQVAVPDSGSSNPTVTTYSVDGSPYSPYGSNTQVTPPDAWVMLKVI